MKHRSLLQRFITLSLMYSLLAVFAYVAIGCNVDQVIETLKVADSVTQKAIPIISPVNQEVATALTRVDTDVQLVIKVYGEYETAAPGDKPSKAELIRATAGAIQNNLRAILSAVGVKNPELVSYIQVAVAVVNSALEVVLGKLPPSVTPPGPVVQARIPAVPLPTIQGAKSAGDLKKAWNDQVRLAYPQSVLK